MNINFKKISCNKYIIIVAAIFFICSSCATTKQNPSTPYSINFLDEYILEANQKYQGHIIGGLSGIDYNNKDFVLITDDPQKTKIFITDITIKDNAIIDIVFKDIIELQCEGINHYDAESIRYFPQEDFYLITTEGNINKQQQPLLLKVNPNGICKKQYTLPKHFDFDYPNKPRNNAVFEGSTIDSDQTGFWVINELPLQLDGKKPKLFNTKSPVRITHYDFNSTTADLQMVYHLDRLVKIPLLPFAVNGATEILQIDDKNMLVIERSYSAGHKSKGNRIKIFLTIMDSNLNSIDMLSLQHQKKNKALKSLIFDSKKIKNKLQHGFIDNIEGVTFGPTLENGNKSLILISDNNYNALGKQINQFILLELIKNK